MAPADLVVYELHVRDFSISPTSGLKYQGKYLALTEPKAIEYLKNLGINAIHFQPVFDYASVDETKLDKPQFNWGYDPKNYNVPEVAAIDIEGMIIHGIENHSDASLVKRHHHLLELLDTGSWSIRVGTVAAFRHIIILGIVTPVELRLIKLGFIY